MSNKAITLKEYIDLGETPQKSQFEIKKVKKPVLSGDNQVLAQTLYLSVDPYMKLQMKNEGLFKPFVLGEPLYGCGIGRVRESSHPDFSENDVIITLKDWNWPAQELVLLDHQSDSSCAKKKVPSHFDAKNYSTLLTCLGLPGMNAYVGLMNYGKPSQGETIIISNPTETIGCIVGQMAKNLGLIVVGLSRSQDEDNYLLNELGFDQVVNYKNKSIRKDLINDINLKCPRGVDIFFDNLGGEISNAVYFCMNESGRVPISVQASYNDTDSYMNFDKLPKEVENEIKDRSLKREFFFINSSSSKDFESAFDYFLNQISNGNIQFKENVYEGIEKWPDAFIEGIFENQQKDGKVIVKVN